MRRGSLTVVGTGIKGAGQVTAEARSSIEQADKVLFGVVDAATRAWVMERNPSAESFVFYREDKPRKDTYERWVDRMLACVREGLKVCVIFYGHPGVCVYASHEAIRRARREGFTAKMLPGISSADCLFADLGIDPAAQGYQSFDATDFLLYRRRFDPTCTLVFRQIGMIGEVAFHQRGGPHMRGLRVLVEVLEPSYGPEHEVVVYEAAQYPIFQPRIERLPLARLSETRITELSTLYIPPQPPASPDPDMLDRLGISRVQARALFPNTPGTDAPPSDEAA